MRRELHQGLRSLRRDPGFTLAALLTLTLGIGATTAVFSVVHGVLLKALPYPRPAELVRVWETDSERGEERGAVAAANLADWRRTDVFLDLAGYQPNYFNLAGGGEPTRVIGAAVTPGFFRTLGADPHPGRAFTAREGRPGGAATVILSQRLWRDAFGADPAVVGSTVLVEGESRTVVGVAPPGFHFPDPRFDLWIPRVIDPGRAERKRHDLQVVGRLAPGVDLEQARSVLAARARALAGEYPATNRGRSVKLLPLLQEVVGDTRPLLLTLFLAVVFVLLIGGANVANLIVARGISRRRELAVRLALGAGRGRLFGEALAESALLTFAGAVLGLLLAAGGVAVLPDLAPDLPRAEAVALDPPVVGFALAVALAASLLFAVLPLTGGVRGRPGDLLRSGGEHGGGRATARLRSVLVAGQVALAFVLLVAAGMLIQGFLRLQAVEPELRTDQVLKMDVSLPLGRYREPPQMVDAFSRILAEVESLPGVEDAAVASSLPLSGTWASRSFEVAESPAARPDEAQYAEYRLVSQGYFAALGIPLLHGRGADDPARREPWVLVNETLAERYWPGRDAVGQRISFTGADGSWLTVRGVVGDVHQLGLEGEVKPEIYQHFAAMPWPWPTFSLVVRTSGSPLDLARSVRQRVWSIDPGLPVTEVASVRALLDRELARPRFTMLLMDLFAVAALLLAAVGIYGVMAYSVRRRAHEIGIRVALGATRSSLLAMVLRQGLRLGATGLVTGLAVLTLVVAVFRRGVFGIQSLGPLTVSGVLLVLAAVVVAASYLPARRATRVQAMEALRQL